MYNFNQLGPQRLFIDKIAFQIPAQHVNALAASCFKTGEFHVLNRGPVFRILIHSEWIEQHDTMAQALMEALWFLAKSGVFTPELFLHIFIAYTCWHQGKNLFHEPVYYLLQWFTFDEMELTLDLPGVEYLGEFDSRVFQQIKKYTFYSLGDYYKEFRAESERSGSVKEVQHSFWIAYRKDIQLGSPVPVYRMEFKFSGKYRKHLSPAFLFLTPDAVYENLIPQIAKITNKLGFKGAIRFNPLHFLMPNNLLAKITSDLGWY